MAKKIDFDTVRKIGLALPDVEDSTSYGAPSLKLRGSLLTCPAINKSAEPNSIVIRVSFDDRDDLLAGEPETYYVTDHYVNYPCVLVRLSRIRQDTLRDLIGMAWKFVAASTPKRRTGKSRS